MITIRPSQERGHFDHGWLDTWHSFSFGAYRDPAHMGFRALRVINDDVIAPGAGFAEHGHANMEIISYVVSGALAHKDSAGHEEVLGPGDVQRMSAGSGIRHSEYNGSREHPTRLLQIWIRPDREGHEPRYDDRAFSVHPRPDQLRLIVSRDGRDGSLDMHQDADVYAGAFSPGVETRHALAPGRHAWVQVVRGEVQLNGVTLGPGDGASVSDETELALRVGRDGAEFLLFDLA